MKNTTTIKWKLSDKPSPDNILKLIEGGVITKEEARKIVLDESEVSQSDIEAVKSELSLLRKMVLELSEKTNNSQTVIKIIESSPIIIREPYRPWTQPWINYYATSTNQSNSSAINQLQCLSNKNFIG